VGIATLLAVAGIGSYFWLQLRPVSAGIAPGVELGTAPGAPVLPAAPNIARPSTPATPKPPPPSPKPAATTSASAQAAIVSSAPAEKRNVETARSTPSPRAPAAPPIPSDQPTRGRLADEAPAAEPEPSVPIRAGSARIRINPGVAAGYQAFQSGDLTAARQAYEQVLRSEPKSSDALHGLAAVNLREGRYDAAQSLYLRALEADPKDALAHSALVNLRGQADPAQSESRIKGLLAAKPDAPYLHFSLGNLYAREGRWTEAQQAYFRAHGGDPENPDYLFNLAISLDQIRQPKLALQYYQNALTAATTRSAAFDPAQVQARIRDLQQ
jgi:tetratricopeptide (TPR) repeat protein